MRQRSLESLHNSSQVCGSLRFSKQQGARVCGAAGFRVAHQPGGLSSHGVRGIDRDPKMAAPSEGAAAASGEGDGGGSGFGSWLDGRLEALGVDRAIYGAYILGVLQEEEEEEKLDALQGILSAFLVRSPDTFL